MKAGIPSKCQQPCPGPPSQRTSRWEHAKRIQHPGCSAMTAFAQRHQTRGNGVTQWKSNDQGQDGIVEWVVKASRSGTVEKSPAQARRHPSNVHEEPPEDPPVPRARNEARTTETNGARRSTRTPFTKRDQPRDAMPCRSCSWFRDALTTPGCDVVQTDLPWPA